MKQLSGESPIDNLQLPNLMRRQDALLLTVGRRVLEASSWVKDELQVGGIEDVCSLDIKVFSNSSCRCSGGSSDGSCEDGSRRSMKNMWLACSEQDIIRKELATCVNSRNSVSQALAPRTATGVSIISYTNRSSVTQPGFDGKSLSPIK